ncbi:uncharacterized protein LOC132292650 [Cornus florida]|uniref:uncharacterized protein LOC132267460 n=1 Tax=Cornus florida TaxID=4283 RepID=UPI00289CD468|nr:uncharacterized protein LOC132267460 [Cornus florida]XP_059646368.1 uncharacterized protein LOC132292650 [Cornus florida]
MASSFSSLCTVIAPSTRSIRSTHKYSLQVRAQSYRDEGRSSNIIDANLSILKMRIEEVRIKERLERCCRSQNGWNYAATYDYKRKRDAELSQVFELLGIVGGTFGLTILSGTLFLCLMSLLVHLNQ